MSLWKETHPYHNKIWFRLKLVNVMKRPGKTISLYELDSSSFNSMKTLCRIKSVWCPYNSYWCHDSTRKAKFSKRWWFIQGFRTTELSGYLMCTKERSVIWLYSKKSQIGWLLIAKSEGLRSFNLILIDFLTNRTHSI